MLASRYPRNRLLLYPYVVLSFTMYLSTSHFPRLHHQTFHIWREQGGIDSKQRSYNRLVCVVHGGDSRNRVNDKQHINISQFAVLRVLRLSLKPPLRPLLQRAPRPQQFLPFSRRPPRPPGTRRSRLRSCPLRHPRRPRRGRVSCPQYSEERPLLRRQHPLDTRRPRRPHRPLR